jgi:hypothetical protein
MKNARSFQTEQLEGYTFLYRDVSVKKNTERWVTVVFGQILPLIPSSRSAKEFSVGNLSSRPSQST